MQLNPLAMDMVSRQLMAGESVREGFKAAGVTRSIMAMEPLLGASLCHSGHAQSGPTASIRSVLTVACSAEPAALKLAMHAAGPMGQAAVVLVHKADLAAGNPRAVELRQLLRGACEQALRLRPEVRLLYLATMDVAETNKSNTSNKSPAVALGRAGVGEHEAHLLKEAQEGHAGRGSRRPHTRASLITLIFLTFLIVMVWYVRRVTRPRFKFPKGAVRESSADRLEPFARDDPTRP